jgi:hypothetical protein
MKDKILQQYKTRDKLFLHEYVNLYVFQVEYGKTENSNANSSKNSTNFIYYWPCKNETYLFHNKGSVRTSQ